MPKFQGGLDGIIKALQLMTNSERERIITDLAKKDPRMADLIESHLFSIKDLEFITDKMLVEFLQAIDLRDLGLAFKLQDEEFVSEFYQRVPKRMAQEIEDFKTSSKIPKRDAEASEQKVLKVFRSMIDEGKLVISHDNDYV